MQAWSPLGNGRLTRFLRDAPEAKQACAKVGAKYGKSAYQAALKWITQSGASFTVEARSAGHFAEDLALFDWQLDKADMEQLEALNKQPDSDAVNKQPHWEKSAGRRAEGVLNAPHCRPEARAKTPWCRSVDCS